MRERREEPTMTTPTQMAIYAVIMLAVIIWYSERL